MKVVVFSTIRSVLVMALLAWGPLELAGAGPANSLCVRGWVYWVCGDQPLCLMCLCGSGCWGLQVCRTAGAVCDFCCGPRGAVH